MPKRVVDGEALWRSEKLGRIQPEKVRAEYANQLPLALANGVFECDARRVWAAVYAFNRPEVSIADVEAMQAEFERVGMLFRWSTSDGKTWGYWVGIERPGRLPSASRLKTRHEALGPEPPESALKAYVDSHRLPDGQPVVALGFGFGFGSGLGSGSPEAENASDSSSPPPADEASLPASHPRETERAVSIPAMELAVLLRQRILENNPKAKITEKQVCEWGREADLMLRRDHRTPEEISALIEWSQRDPFWKTNILSMGKVREKFDQLTMKKGREKGASHANRGDRKPTNAINSRRGTDYSAGRTVLPEL
jgi:hypothetical protein